MLFGVIAAAVAFWCAVAVVAGLVVGWSTTVLGSLAVGAAAGGVTSAALFAHIRRRPGD